MDANPSAPRYYSFDRLSASNGAGTLDLHGNIYRNDPSTLFADGKLHMGLLEGDELDGLALDDTYEPGILNPGIDKALFGLGASSPSTFTYTGNEYIPGVPGHLSPSDILYTDFTGTYSLHTPAADLGLMSSDGMNGLDTLDVPPIPEPGTSMLVAFAAIGLLVRRRLAEFGR
jgi:hypothetical protein